MHGVNGPRALERLEDLDLACRRIVGEELARLGVALGHCAHIRDLLRRDR
jgi:hypothetical protein